MACSTKSGVSVPRKRRTDLYENALSSLVRVTPDIKSLSSDGRRVGVYRVYLLTCVLNRALDNLLQSQSEPYLLQMSDLLEYVGQVMFVGTQCVMHDLERSAQQVPCDDMQGKHDCGMCTQDFSINLTNSSHYDVGDASRGYAVWVEGGAVRGKSGNDGWYFVLPNVVVVSGQEGGKCGKQGIAIKLDLDMG